MGLAHRRPVARYGVAEHSVFATTVLLTLPLTVLLWAAGFAQASAGEWPLQEGQPKVVEFSGDEAAGVRPLFERLLSLKEKKAGGKTERKLATIVGRDSTLDEMVYDTVSCALPFTMVPHRALLLKVWIGGTGHYIYAWAIHETELGFKVFEFYGSEKSCGQWNVLQDLDKDGVPEIVMKQFVGDYEGCFTVVDWTAIYQWNGETYVRADEKYPRYYARHVVPRYLRMLKDNMEFKDDENSMLYGIYEKLVFVLKKAESIAAMETAAQ